MCGFEHSTARCARCFRRSPLLVRHVPALLNGSLLPRFLCPADLEHDDLSDDQLLPVADHEAAATTARTGHELQFANPVIPPGVIALPP